MALRDISDGVRAGSPHSLVPALDGNATGRDGVLTAVESVLTLDADFWRAFGSREAAAAGCAEVAGRRLSGTGAGDENRTRAISLGS